MCHVAAQFECLLLQITVYAAYLYDAVMLYAKAVHRVLEEGGNLTDGTAIIGKILDSNYTGRELLMWKNIDVQSEANIQYVLAQRGNETVSVFENIVVQACI